MSKDPEELGTSVQPAESAGCTLGISLALGVLALCFLGVLGMRFLPAVLQGDLEASALIEQTFKGQQPPFNLIESGSRDFRGRASVIRLAKAGLDEEREAARAAWEQAAEMAGEESPSVELPKAEPAVESELEADDEEQDAAEAKIAKPKGMLPLDVEPGSLDPIELLLVNYAQVELLIAAFKTGGGGFGDFGDEDSDEEVSRHLERWNADASDEWQTTLMRDKVRWDGWEADFHIDRSFKEGGAWSDSVKLNLGLADRNLALYVHWPDGYEVTREDVEQVVRTVRM